jgi:hypothetical protein
MTDWSEFWKRFSPSVRDRQSIPPQKFGAVQKDKRLSFRAQFELVVERRSALHCLCVEPIIVLDIDRSTKNASATAESTNTPKLVESILNFRLDRPLILISPRPLFNTDEHPRQLKIGRY